MSEGTSKKFIDKVDQITFNGEYERAKGGRKILYVTERAVLELRPEGLTLTEIAPGVDLQKDILDQMEFVPVVSEELKIMDPCIFKDCPMDLKARMA
jgi:propionate CoA-transferase